MIIRCARVGGPNRRAAYSTTCSRIPLPRKAARLIGVCTDFEPQSTQDIARLVVSERVEAPAAARVTVRSSGHASELILRERQRSTTNSIKKQSPRPRSFGRGKGLRLSTSSEDTIAPTSGLGASLSLDTVTACRSDACLRPASPISRPTWGGFVTPRSADHHTESSRGRLRCQRTAADPGPGRKSVGSARVPR